MVSGLVHVTIVVGLMFAQAEEYVTADEIGNQYEISY